MNFFVNKVKGIRKDMQDNLREENEFQPVLSKYDTRPPRHLPAFLPTTAEEVKKFVLSSNNKSCELDPAPTEIIKKAIDLVALPMATIINKSLDEGLVPESMKKAIIKPILKEPALDPDQISNYRPVSNLSFLSKILEKIVNVQLERHLETNNLLDPSQSAYRKNHSTETVLVKVLNDILLALDRGHATILAMVDVSAAFDAVDHERLLERHNQYFGMTGKALVTGWHRICMGGHKLLLWNPISQTSALLLLGFPKDPSLVERNLQCILRPSAMSLKPTA